MKTSLDFALVVKLALIAVVICCLAYQAQPATRIFVADYANQYIHGFRDEIVNTADGPARWARASAQIRFPNVGYSAPMLLTIRANALRDETRVYTATVRMNGAIVGVINRAGLRDWKFQTTELVSPGDDIVVAINSLVYVPSEVYQDSNDTRQLGVLVASVAIEPQAQTITLPPLAPILFCVWLAVVGFFLGRYLRLARNIAFGLAVFCVLVFAFLVVFFRLESNHHVIIAVGAFTLISLCAIVADPQLVVSKDSAYLGPQTVMVMIFFCAIALWLTMPWGTALDTHVIGVGEDDFYYTWVIGWVQQSILQGRSPLVIPFANYPAGQNIAYTELSPLTIVATLPFAWFAGNVTAYNLANLFSFVLSGLGVFLWTRRMAGNAAGFIGGFVFAFAPYRMAHLMGHFNLVETQWFVFYFLCLSCLLEQRKWSWRWISITVLFAGFIGLTSVYYLYMAILISLVYIIGYLLFSKRVREKTIWKQLGAFLVFSLPLVLISILPFAWLALRGEMARHAFAEVAHWSASLTDVFLPSSFHPGWGKWFEERVRLASRGAIGYENEIYVGLVAVVLAINGFFKRKQMPQIKSIFIAGVSALILALGTNLYWLEQPVPIPIPLPGYWLYEYLPFYGAMRVWMRYSIFISLFVSVLAGIGSAWLAQRISQRRAPIILGIIFALVVIDLYPSTPFLHHYSARAVDNWLAEQPGQGAVAEFPQFEMQHPSQLMYSDVRNKPFIGTGFWTFLPAEYRQIQSAMDTFPSQSSVAVLRERGVQWVIVNSSAYPDFSTTRAKIENLDLRYVIDLDGKFVFILGE